MGGLVGGSCKGGFWRPSSLRRIEDHRLYLHRAIPGLYAGQLHDADCVLALPQYVAQQS